MIVGMRSMVRRQAVGEVAQPVSEDREKPLRNMATLHMAKGLAQGVVYHASLLKGTPQQIIGPANCCERHARMLAV